MTDSEIRIPAASASGCTDSSEMNSFTAVFFSYQYFIILARQHIAACVCKPWQRSVFTPGTVIIIRCQVCRKRSRSQIIVAEFRVCSLLRAFVCGQNDPRLLIYAGTYTAVCTYEAERVSSLILFIHQYA